MAEVKNLKKVGFEGKWGGASQPLTEGVEIYTVAEVKKIGWRVSDTVRQTNRKKLDANKKPIPTGKKDAAGNDLFVMEPGALFLKVFPVKDSNKFEICYLSKGLRANVTVGDKLTAENISLVVVDEGTEFNGETVEEAFIIIGRAGGQEDFM